MNNYVRSKNKRAATEAQLQLAIETFDRQQCAFSKHYSGLGELLKAQVNTEAVENKAIPD